MRAPTNTESICTKLKIPTNPNLSVSSDSIILNVVKNIFLFSKSFAQDDITSFNNCDKISQKTDDTPLE